MNTLQIFEKKIIANRIWLFNHYNILIKNLIHNGVYFFNLKVNFNYDILIESKKICIDIFKGTAIEFKTPQECMDFRINYFNNIFSSIELIDFSYTVIEKSEKENHYHAHILLCVRGIDPRIESVERHILNIFNFSDLQYEDYVLKPLNSFFDVKSFLIHVSKNLDRLDKHVNKSYFHFFSSINHNDYSHLGSLMETSCSDNPSVIFDSKVHFNLDDLLACNRSFNGKYNLIRGCNFKNMDQKNIIVYYINLYLKLNNYFFYKSNLYKKKDTSKFSYCYSGSSLELIKLLPDIFKYFAINFDTISFNEIWSNVISNPLYVKEIITSEIKIFRHKKLNFNTLEFTDGLFNLEQDLFIPFDDSFFEKTKELYLIQYYNISYIDSIKNTKLKIWLKLLPKNMRNVNNFCTKLGLYLYLGK